jgi:hypothetical protein
MVTPGGETVLVAALVAGVVLGSAVPGATLAFAGSDVDDDWGGGPTEESRAVTTGTERSVLVPGERVAAVEPVTGCRVIDSPGRYELQRDIVDGRALNCIDIRSSDVVFDGNGHTIDAVQLSNFVSSGIVARDGSNVTVRNVTVTEFKGSGVAFFSTDDTVVSDVRIRDGPLVVSNANATVRAVNVANPNEPDGSGVIVIRSTVTLRDVSATDNRFGFRFLRSGGHTLVNVSATDSEEVAFRFDDAGNNTLEDVSATDSGGRGFEFVGSGGNTLLDVSVTNTSGDGLSFERSGDNTLADLSVERVGEVGVVFFNDSGGNTLTDLSTVDTGVEGLLFADSGENTLTDVSVVGANRNGVGFIQIHAVDGSPNNTLVDVEISDSRMRGLVLSRASGTTLEDSSVVDSGVGLLVGESDDVVIEDLFVENASVEEAIRIVLSDNATIHDARVLGGEFFGLHVVESSGLRVTDLEVERTEAGVVLSDIVDGILMDLSVTDTDGNGIEVDTSTDVRIQDTTVLRSGGWDLSLTNSTDEVAVTDLTTESATLSFAGRDIAIASVDSPPTDPTSPERINVGVHVNATSTAAGGYLDLTVAYTDDDADAANIDESTLRLWRFEDSAWSAVPGSTVDTTTDEVSATVTEFGVFAPLGIEASDGDDSDGGGDDEGETNEPPVAAFDLSTNITEIGTAVGFDASASDDPDGVISRYEWDFDGDGQTDAAHVVPRANHTYASAGTFDVSLTVADTFGVTDTATRTVEVTESADPDDGSGDDATPTEAPTTTPAPTLTLTPVETATPTAPATPFGVPLLWPLLVLLAIVGAVLLFRARP